MLNPLFDSVKETIEEMRVYYKRVNNFEYSLDGWQYCKQYPAIAYNLTIVGLHRQEYLYNQSYVDLNGDTQLVNPIFVSSGPIQTKTIENGGVAVYTKSGYYDYVLHRYPTPYIIKLELTTMAKKPREDRELQEQILKQFGDRGAITVTISEFGSTYTESWDMEQKRISDKSDYYSRIMDQRLLSRKYEYEIEAWLYFGTTGTAYGVQSRFFEEHMLDNISTPTGISVTSYFTGTYYPDGGS